MAQSVMDATTACKTSTVGSLPGIGTLAGQWLLSPHTRMTPIMISDKSGEETM